MSTLRDNGNGTYTRILTPLERYDKACERLAKAERWHADGYSDLAAFVSYWQDVRDTALDEMIDAEQALSEDWSSRRYRRS